jgi:hypothetical protein
MIVSLITFILTIAFYSYWNEIRTFLVSLKPKKEGRIVPKQNKEERCYTTLSAMNHNCK